MELLIFGVLCAVGVILIVGVAITASVIESEKTPSEEAAESETAANKEKGDMFNGKNGKAFEKLIGLAKKTLKEAEQRQEELADLPDIGEVPQFKEMLSKSTKGLRAALEMPVGAEMQVQVVQWLAMTSEAMIKVEEIRIRVSLAKEKAGQTAALGPVEVRYGLLSGVEILNVVEELQPEIGYDMEPYRPAIQNYSKQLVALQLHKQFASQAGIELPKGFMEPLQGMEVLGPVNWDPSRALDAGADDVNDDNVDAAEDEGTLEPEEDVIEGTYTERSD